MAVVDGDNGMGHLVVSRAVEIAIEKARSTGVAWVGARYSNHAGPGIAVCAHADRARHDRPVLRGRQRQPPAAVGRRRDAAVDQPDRRAASRRGDEPPVVLDMATTVAAYGKVKAKAKRGEMMPEGWMIDREGQPLLDPKRADEGFLLPIGGHKGYGLALIVGLLAGTLQGAAMGRDVIDFNKDAVTHHQHRPGDPGDRPARVRRSGRVQGARRHASCATSATANGSPGVERIWLPGEQSHARRERYRVEGIPVSTGVVNEIAAMAREIGIEPLV